jgi:antitoxin ParD1/3/4
MNISITDPMRAWVQEQVESGQYADNSDYVRDLICRDQERVKRIEAMQAAITKGSESGEPTDFDIDAFKQRMLNNFNDETL